MKRLVIFAHYDARNQVKAYVLHHLQALRSIAENVWFVSTAALSDPELAKPSSLCERAWTRENIGYDFGMWSGALSEVDFSSWDEIVLTNSSVFGPLWPLRSAFAKMESTPLDMWSMTDNVEFESHLQSYFLVFRRRVLDAPEFRAFWRDIQPFERKHEIIRNYEVGLSQLVRRLGFRAEALVPLSSLPPRPLLRRLRQPTRFNPTLLQPLALLERGMPYVKLELLRDNPLRVRLRPIFAAIERAGYPRALLEIEPAPVPK